MMDANEVLETRSVLAEWASRLDLQDLHKNQPAPSTYIGSKHRRIDHIFGCHQINNYKVAAGTLSYIDGPQPDHRGLFVDIDLYGYLSYDPHSNPHINSATRSLRTGNPELVLAYMQMMLKYYERHKMEERMAQLYKNFKNMTIEQIKDELEA
jgi:hypothetical protein